MPLRSLRLAVAIAVLLTCSFRVHAEAQKRTINEKDIFKFVWVADPQISPDGSQVAFVRVNVNETSDQYETAIWMVKADGSEPPRRMTNGIRDLSPRW